MLTARNSKVSVEIALFLVIVCGIIFGVNLSYAITRDQVISNADAYATHSWYCSSENASGCGSQTSCPVDYSKFGAGWHTGVAYKWGGFDSIESFDQKLGDGYTAGDVTGTSCTASCATGVDCSGYVSRCWGLTSKYSTRTLPNISQEVSQDSLKKGDILNKYGNHVVLFDKLAGNGSPIVYESVYGSPHKVFYHTTSWWALSGYSPRRYDNIEERDVYAAKYDGQADYPSPVVPGQDYEWWIEFKNTGTETWRRGSVNLGCGTASNNDQYYDIVHSSWGDSYRPTSMDQSSVRPGEVARFTFTFEVPENAQPGWSRNYNFTPVAEGICWMRQSDGNELNAYMRYKAGEAAKPDLIVDDIWTDPSNPMVGESVRLYARIKNAGNAEVSGIRLEYYIDGNYVGDDTHSGLYPNGTKDEYKSSYEFVSYGNRNYRVEVDSVAGESNTGNNDKTKTVYVKPKPSTRIISLSGNLSFGDVQVNSTDTRTLTISNDGNSALYVSSVSCPSGFSGNWSGNVSAGGSRNMTVTFSPASARNYGGTITVNSDKTGGSGIISVSGRGKESPTRIISLSGNLSFSDVQVNSTDTRTLTISNDGNSALYVSSVSCPSGFSGNWSGNVSAGGSRNMTVTFSPASARNYGGTITVNSDKTGGSGIISVSGRGKESPTRIISLSGNLSFSDVQVNSTDTRTLTISNDGNSALYVSSVICPSGFSGNWSGNVSAGDSRNVIVTFAPASARNYSGTITVNSDKTGGTGTISVSGKGTEVPTRIISLSGNLDFGDIQINSTATRTLTISNDGSSTLYVSSVICPSGFSGNWSGNVSAGGSRNMTVTFSPASARNYGDTITINSNKTGGTGTISVSGKGIEDAFYIRGDVNGDGSVGLDDVKLAFKLSLGVSTTPQQFEAANVYEDGDGNTSISIHDVKGVFRLSLGGSL